MRDMRFIQLLVICMLFNIGTLIASSTTTATTTEKNKKELKEGEDDLFKNRHKVQLNYDDNIPILDPADCSLKAKFNLKIDGLNVTFENKSAGNHSHIEWIFGDGIISHDNKAAHTYDEGGSYYFSITVVDESTGCLDFFTGTFFLFDQEKIMVAHAARQEARLQKEGAELLEKAIAKEVKQSAKLPVCMY